MQATEHQTTAPGRPEAGTSCGRPFAEGLTRGSSSSTDVSPADVATLVSAMSPSHLMRWAHHGHGSGTGCHSHSMSYGASGLRSYNSQSCRPSSSEVLHCVSDGKAVHVQRLLRWVRRQRRQGLPVPTLAERRNPVNLYNTSTICTPHSTGITGTGEMRLSDAEINECKTA